MSTVRSSPRKNDPLQLQHPERVGVERIAPWEDGTPRIRWMGTYKNEHGQVFQIWVSGAEEDVNAYVKSLRLALLALPLDRNSEQAKTWTRYWRPPTWAAPPKPAEQPEDEPGMDTEPAPDNPAHDRVINILAGDLGEIKPPYRLIFTLDPEAVWSGATDWYPFTSGSSGGLTETTRADNGWVKSTLYRTAGNPPSTDVDSFNNTPRPKRLTMGVPTSRGLCLGVRNQWGGHTSTYTLTGEVVTGVNHPQETRCV
jgi:hypothetical protein